MNKHIAMVCALGASVTLGACASQPTDISAAYVSPTQYDKYSCDQVRMELARVTRKAQDLHGTLKKKADDDQAQAAIGLVLLWPTLFFLEGGDGPQAAEYARLKGERDALEEIAIQKSCSIVVEPLTPKSTDDADKTESAS